MVASSSTPNGLKRRCSQQLGERQDFSLTEPHLLRPPDRELINHLPFARRNAKTLTGLHHSRRRHLLFFARQQREARTMRAARGRTERITTWRRLFQQKRPVSKGSGLVFNSLCRGSAVFVQYFLRVATHQVAQQHTGDPHQSLCDSHAHTRMAKVHTVVSDF